MLYYSALNGNIKKVENEVFASISTFLIYTTEILPYRHFYHLLIPVLELVNGHGVSNMAFFFAVPHQEITKAFGWSN